MAELAGLVQRLEGGRWPSIKNDGLSAWSKWYCTYRLLPPAAVSVYVDAYDSLISGPVAQYLALSQKIGGDVQKHADMMKQAFACQRQLLVMASGSQKPSDVSSAIQEVQSFRELHRSSPLFNHLSAVSESVPALGWVAMVSGGALLPPPMGPQLDTSRWLTPAEANQVTPLFASLNKGSGHHQGLKHVSDDQKTHKNPALKGPGGPLRSGPKPFSSPKAAAASPARSLPAVLELDGKKWKVENQEGAQGLVISDTELKQVVYAFKCSNSTLQVKGKINSITVDNCKKMGLVFDDVVGIVEVINCKDVKVQVMGKVPTISINKTDGCHVYLSPDSLQCEIVSAKSSEMNVLVPGKDGDYTELPVPEQFKTVWDGKKLVTTATEIAG
uniref:C-CAP/cofactor C-like domain-containing protein n=1 Tax=Denticeps clupeoides TaxID=299321 RepID=A0AAY4C617_9TELE